MFGLHICICIDMTLVQSYIRNSKCNTGCLDYTYVYIRNSKHKSGVMISNQFCQLHVYELNLTAYTGILNNQYCTGYW